MFKQNYLLLYTRFEYITGEKQESVIPPYFCFFQDCSYCHTNRRVMDCAMLVLISLIAMANYLQHQLEKKWCFCLQLAD